MRIATATQPRDKAEPSVWRLLFGRTPAPTPDAPRCTLADAMLCKRAIAPVWTVDLFAG
jgi:hypothetical protein